MQKLQQSGYSSPGERFAVTDSLLDRAESGPVWLKDGRIAGVVVETLKQGVALNHYGLFCYVVMPNHVHIVIEPRVPLARITNGIKGVSSRKANLILGTTGQPFWQDESFDHWIRSAREGEAIRHYVEHNPVKAGLVGSPAEWPWSSAAK